jgi:hypothetical protein
MRPALSDMAVYGVIRRNTIVLNSAYKFLRLVHLQVTVLYYNVRYGITVVVFSTATLLTTLGSGTLRTGLGC